MAQRRDTWQLRPPGLQPCAQCELIVLHIETTSPWQSNSWSRCTCANEHQYLSIISVHVAGMFGHMQAQQLRQILKLLC